MIRLSKEQVQAIVSGLLDVMEVKDLPAHVTISELVTAYKIVIEKIHPERSTSYMKGISHIPEVIKEELREIGLTYPIITRKSAKVKADFKMESSKATEEPAQLEPAIEPVAVAEVPSLDWSVAKLMAVLVDKLVDERLESRLEEYFKKIELTVENRLKEALGGAIRRVSDVQAEVWHPKHNPEPVQGPRKEKYKILVVGAKGKQPDLIKGVLGEVVEAHFITSNAHRALSDKVKFSKYDLIVIWTKFIGHALGEICAGAKQPFIMISTKEGIGTMCSRVEARLGLNE